MENMPRQQKSLSLDGGGAASMPASVQTAYSGDSASPADLLEFFDKKELRSLLADFYALTGIGAAVVDLQGRVLTASEGQDICMRFHRIHPKTALNCIDSATFRIQNVPPGGYLLYKCKNHLWDVIAPIRIGEKHLGNLFLGQFFFEDEAIDKKVFLDQAEACNFDPETYLDALNRVPRISREKIDAAMGFSARLALMLSRMAYDNQALNHALTDQIRARKIAALQRDLTLALYNASSSQESLRLCLEAVMETSGFDAGGIYIIDAATESFRLAAAKGVSETFAAGAGEEPFDSFRGKIVMAGTPVFITSEDIIALGHEDLLNEKFRSLAVFPIIHQGDIIGCLNLASHRRDDVPQESRYLLESAVQHVGQSLLRIQDEERLRRSEEDYRELVEGANSIILRIDKTGKLNFCNRYAQAFFGFSEEEMIGRNAIGTIFPETDWSGRDLRSMIDAMLLDPERYANGETESIRRSGERVWISWTNRPLYDDKGAVVEMLCIGNDITNLKRAEAEKKLLEDQLQQAQKMESIGTMAGGIAHDFNNILASVMGYTEMAVKESCSDRQRRYLDQVLKASERARNLVGQILAFSRQTEHRRQTLDIRGIVKDSLKLLRATIPSTIEIRQAISSEACAVLADPTQIHQIMINLCNNAAHAMQDRHGVLEVGLSGIRMLREMLIIHPDLREGAYVLLTVRDTGHGIDPAIKDKIFDPFFTTKKSREGTGLGLSVVYGIVKSHGGALSVQSDPGVGTTFSIYLPKVEKDDGEQEAREVVELIGGKERILFVDDEKALVELVPVFLRNLGYEVVSTASSPDALSMFTKNPQHFDLVVTDMTMPQMTGLDLSEKILALRKDIPIILCTGYHESITRSEAVGRGIVELVTKPVSLAELGVLLRKVLDHKHPESR